VTKEWEPYITTLRKDGFSSVIATSDDGRDFIAAYSSVSYAKIEAIINISRTLFVCFVLSVASIYFTKDAQSLVLDPLERMIEKVKLIAKNPLAAASDEVHEAGIMSFKQKEEGQNSAEEHKEA